MAVCAAYQVPHSQFLGWDKPDRDKAIWWHIRSNEACGSCGTRRAEWDPEQGGHGEAYVATPSRCPGCEQIELARDSPEASAGRGVQVLLKPNPDVERRPRGTA